MAVTHKEDDIKTSAEEVTTAAAAAAATTLRIAAAAKEEYMHARGLGPQEISTKQQQQQRSSSTSEDEMENRNRQQKSCSRLREGSESVPPQIQRKRNKTKRTMKAFLILHGVEMWKRGRNNLIRDALVFVPFKVGEIIGGNSCCRFE